MKNFLVFLLFLFIAAGATVVLARNSIIKTAMEMGVTQLTGFKTSVGSVSYDLPSTIRIQDLVIRNPGGFREPVFVNIPEIYVSLVLPDLLKAHKIHLQEVRLNLKEVHLEKNAQGVSNVQLLSSVGASAQQPGAPAPAKKAPSEKQPAVPFALDRLELSIHDVSFEDHSGLIGAAPVPSRMKVDLGVEKEVFSNITDPQALVNLILMKILRGVTFGKLLNINPDKLLNENLVGVLNSGQEILDRQTEALKGQLGNVAGQATSVLGKTEVTQKTGALVQNSYGGAKNILGNTTSAATGKVSGFLGKMKSSVQSGTETAQTPEKTQ